MLVIGACFRNSECAREMLVPMLYNASKHFVFGLETIILTSIVKMLMFTTQRNVDLENYFQVVNSKPGI